MTNDKSYEIMNNLTIVLKGINRKVSHKVDRKKFNISSFMILRMLSENTEKTLTEIADSLGLPNSTTSVLVNKLVKEGVLNRIRNEKDRRKVIIYITEMGKEKLEEIHEIHLQHFREVLHNTSSEDANLILNGLKAFVKVVEGYNSNNI